jgi:hypothetical protein
MTWKFHVDNDQVHSAILECVGNASRGVSILAIAIEVHF